MSSLGKFVKHYGAHPLQRSSRNTILGELYQQGFLSRRLRLLNTNVVIRLGLDAAAREDLRQRLTTVEKVEANFPDIDLTQDIHVDADLDLPNVLDELQAEVTANQVLSFKFKGVLEQRLTDELRLEIERLIDNVEDNNPAAYKEHLKRFEMAAALYYAEEVVIRRKSGFTLSAGAQRAVAEVGGTVQVNVNGEEEIRYNQHNCPFATAIVHIKDLEA